MFDDVWIGKVMDKWGIVHCHVSLPEGKLLSWINLVKHAREPHFWCNYSNPVPSQNIAELVFILFSCYIPFPDLKDNLYLLIPRLNYVYTYKPIGAMTHSYGGIVEPNRWAGLFPWALGWSGSQLVWRKNEEYIYTYIHEISGICILMWQMFREHMIWKSYGILGYPIFKPKWQRTCILDPESPWSWKLRYQTAHKIDDFPIEHIKPSGHLPSMSDFSRDSRPCPVWSTDRPKGRRTFQCIRGSSVTNGSPVGWWFLENYATQYSGDDHDPWEILLVFNTAQQEAIS